MRLSTYVLLTNISVHPIAVTWPIPKTPFPLLLFVDHNTAYCLFSTNRPTKQRQERCW